MPKPTTPADPPATPAPQANDLAYTAATRALDAIGKAAAITDSPSTDAALANADFHRWMQVAEAYRALTNTIAERGTSIYPTIQRTDR